MYSTSCYFNGFDLNTIDGVTIYNYSSIDLPDRTLFDNKIARADKTLLTSAEYTTKEVAVYGRIAGTDKDTREQILDTLKGYIQEPNKTLKLSQSGTNIEWTATLQDMDLKQYGPWLKFVLIFKATDPIGKDEDVATALNVSGITSATSTQSMTIAGSYKANPTITFTLTAVTGGTSQSVSIGNAEIGQALTVTRDWTAGDIMTIDCENYIVSVNGVEVDYSGLFPYFYPGNRSISYVDTFSTRTVGIVVNYYKKYS